MRKKFLLMPLIVIAIIVIEGFSSHLRAGINPTTIDYPAGTRGGSLLLGDVFDPTQTTAPYLPNATYPHFVNILSYGADKSGATDSWPAIQQAMNYLCLLKTGGPGIEPRVKGIYFPKGTYLVSRPIDEMWTDETTGDITSGSAVVMNVANTQGLPNPGSSKDPFGVVGMVVDGNGAITGAYDTTFPVGTYVKSVSGTTVTLSGTATSTLAGKHLQFRKNACRISLIGENNDPTTGTIIKLASTAFTNNLFKTFTTHPLGVIKTESDGTMGNDADADMIWNMTIDTGTGNTGAAGISFAGNNMASIRDVLVRSSQSNPTGYGIDLGLAYTGPCLLSDVEVDGFAVGIYVAQEEDSVTLDTITLSGQTQYGIENAGNSVFIANLTGTNTVPAIYNAGATSLVTVINSTANGGSSGNSAIVNSGGCYARNFTSSTNYTNGILNTATLGTNLNGGTGNLANYDSHAVLTPGLAGSLNTPLNLPTLPTTLPYPDFTTDPPSNWYDVETDHAMPDTGTDQTANIQAAITNAAAAGKQTVYFPPGEYLVTKSIQVSGSIKRIMGAGAGAAIIPWNSQHNTGFGNKATSPPTPVFVIGGAGANDMQNTLEMDHLFNYYSSDGLNNTFVQQNTAQMVITRDCELGGNNAWTETSAGWGAAYTGLPGAGNFYLENCDGTYWTFSPGQNVWARQLNTEGYSTSPKITNQGATLWILGLKTEENGTVIEATNGSETEIDGGFSYCTNSNPSTANLFDVQDSDFSASFDTAGSVDYPNLVGETEGTVSKMVFDAISTITPRAYIRDSHNSSMVPLVVAAMPGNQIPVPGIDIGMIGLTGTGSFANDIYTVTGAGVAIHSTADAFHYCSLSENTDCTIVAEVMTLQNTSQGAEAGVMMRATTDQGSATIAGNMFAHEFAYILRPTQGASATQAVATGLTLPYWVKLVRSGSTFTSFYSADGSPGSWIQWRTNTFTAGSPFYAGSTLMVGLDVCSGSTNATCTATFSNVAITSP